MMVVSPNILAELVKLEVIEMFPFLEKEVIQIDNYNIYLSASNIRKMTLQIETGRKIVRHDYHGILGGNITQIMTSSGPYKVVSGFLAEDGNDVLKDML